MCVHSLSLSLWLYFRISHIAYCTSCIVQANYWDFYIELSWERPPTTTFYNSKFLASILFDALRYFENTQRRHAGAGNDPAANYSGTTNFTRDTWYSRSREFARSTSAQRKCALNVTQTLLSRSTVKRCSAFSWWWYIIRHEDWRKVAPCVARINNTWSVIESRIRNVPQ